jgi:uncharacterized membrane protein
MDGRLRMLIGASIGATAMYYLDPARGRSRRALAENQLVHLGHKSRRAAAVAGRDLYNRAVGAGAALRSTLATAAPDDDVLEARVRSCLGRIVSHAASVHVEARDGTVTLSGPILESEVTRLITCVRRVRGVKDVRNELEVHAEAGRVPGLQGDSRRRGGGHAPFMQAKWSPTERVAGAIGGGVAMLGGLRQRGFVGSALGAAGLLLLGRSASNLEMRRLLGVGVPRQSIEVQKSIRIQAPVGDVFAIWDDTERFPSFMSHVLRVRRLDMGNGKNRWRWTVEGPSGMHVEFDAVVTQREENRLIAWRTDSRAAVQHSGTVTFIGNDDGTTTVDVRMVYTPIGGALGHAAAWLLGADPKHRMDDDLLRMKTYLETGGVPRDAAVHSTQGQRAQRSDDATRAASRRA